MPEHVVQHEPSQPHPVTDRTGTGCETWGVPDVAQREGKAVEAAQLRGELNPGNGLEKD
ncbi:hypothetical protein [Streptomyces sp. NBC_00162]|uniref:hypothetical protein n=1 Tax=Streptomyces sp. NBC_00162 TaxID=2903629 RepID=UPI00214B8520|nr:hypothetical protein [Streptomyces sp. NBC_00162]UUU44182.1 hypothetical protein JIW86_38670 [Streptomyces sp. NBC_00162]